MVMSVLRSTTIPLISGHKVITDTVHAAFALKEEELFTSLSPNIAQAHRLKAPFNNL